MCQDLKGSLYIWLLPRSNFSTLVLLSVRVAKPHRWHPSNRKVLQNLYEFALTCAIGFSMTKKYLVLQRLPFLHDSHTEGITYFNTNISEARAFKKALRIEFHSSSFLGFGSFNFSSEITLAVPCMPRNTVQTVSFKMLKVSTQLHSRITCN